MALPWNLGPVAHRGYHDIDRGIVENAPAAVDAALREGFAIEVDLQISADGVAMVFHDFTLDRLTEETGPVRAKSAKALSALPYTAGDDRIMTLDDLFAMVDGQVPLYVELKSDFSGDMSLVSAAAKSVNAYHGPVALMSFDPRMVRMGQTLCPRIPGGIVSGAYATPGWERHVESALQRFLLRHMLTSVFPRPAFVNYDISAIDTWAPRFARMMDMPVLTWTVRTERDRAQASRWADAMVFEGFVPTDAERQVS